MFCPGLPLFPSFIPQLHPLSPSVVLLCCLKFKMGSSCLSSHLPRVLLLKVKSAYPANIPQKPFPSLDWKKMIHVCHTCALNRRVCPSANLHGRSMERSSVAFHLDSLGLEKLERSLFFLLLEWGWSLSRKLDFNHFFPPCLQPFTAIFKLGEHWYWKGCAYPDRLYRGASQGCSAAQHRGVKELWRPGKPRGCWRQCPKWPEVQTELCIFLPGRESPRLLYHRKWQFWSEAGLIVWSRFVILWEKRSVHFSHTAVWSCRFKSSRFKSS